MMSTEKKPAKRIYTLATAIGLALGSMGIAAAATAPDQPASAVTQTQAPSVGSQGTEAADDVAEADEVGVPDDEATDGVDHQDEDENVGNNDGQAEGPDDVIGGDDDATEAAEEESATDEATDGIDFQQEGENVGNNGGPAEGPDDVIGGDDDATEAADG